MTNTTPARFDAVQRASLLSAATAEELCELAERCLADRPDPRLLIGPEVGTVMLQVREPVVEERFFLGEVLVTRAEVIHAGERGWSMRMGDDREATLAAAILDAEVAAAGPMAGHVEALCRQTAARIDQEELDEWAELAATEVHFEELDQ